MKIQFQHWLRRLLCAALVAVCGSTLMAADEESAMLTIGSKAPSLDVEHWISDGKGKFKPVKDFEKNQVYVVEFWATWCGPCIGSMPHLAETQEKYADKKVQLVSISDEDLSTVEKFLKKDVKDGDEGQTYADLTSAYCLTTDPDRSVYSDYMEAAGQNGIPTAFIVGKTGLIEWIGHPMEMDKPLEEVVGDKWDRAVYLAKFKAEQERNVLMTKVMKLARKGDLEGAMELIAKMKEEAKDDAETVSMLENMAINVQLSSAAQKLQKGENVKEALEQLDALAKSASPEMAQQIELGKCQLLLMLALNSGKHVDLASASLNDLASKKEVNPTMLNMLAWNVYEASESKEDVSKDLIAAATKLAERAVKEAPDQGAIIDTLAHLVYAQGDLNRAIELQTEAVKKADPQTKADVEKFLEELKSKKK